MTLIFNEKFAINPQSAESGGGGGEIVNTVDWSKIGLTSSRNTTMPSNYTYPVIFNGRLWISQPNEGFYPRGSSEDNGTTKVVDFSKPFEIHAKITAPTYVTNKPSCVFGNCYSNQYAKICKYI